MKFKKIIFDLKESKKAKKAIEVEKIKVEKSMLQLTYDWEAKNGDNSEEIVIDKTFFDRDQGYEVLVMIQAVVDNFGYTSVSDVRKIEAVIANKLPGSIRSRENVRDWLVNYLSKR
jgi:hypothetical protein